LKSIDSVKKKAIPFIAIILCLVTFSCGSNANDVFEAKLKRALENDKVIDKAEFEQLKTFVLRNKDEFKSIILPEGTVDIELLANRIRLFSKKLGAPEAPEIEFPSKLIDVPKLKNINVYIENSASMDGYVAKSSDFEAALSDLLVQTIYKYEKNKLKVSFINSRIYPSQITEVEDFVNALEPTEKPYKTGNRSASKLNNILDSILRRTSKNDISILVSDCIYSLGKNKDTEGGLQFQKSLTKNVILQKSKQFDLSTAIFKMDSGFNGIYYDKNDKRTTLENTRRPYFIWVTGATLLLNDFLNKIDITGLEGYKNQYILEPNFNNASPYYSVLKATAKKGGFREVDRKTKQIKAMEDVEFRKGVFEFSVAIDLSGVKADADYYSNPENYEVTSGFRLKGIEEFTAEKVHKYDYKILAETPATHFLTFSLDPKAGIKNLVFSLKKKMPEWIEASSTTDDFDIKEIPGKTFGLYYLISGVSEAYKTLNENSDSHLTVEITINP
jgi:hypothetical protein